MRCEFFPQENIPTVSILCNPGIRTRHWEQMSSIVDYDLTPNSGTTLRKVLRLNLTSSLEQFESISAAASKVRPAWGLQGSTVCKDILFISALLIN